MRKHVVLGLSLLVLSLLLLSSCQSRGASNPIKGMNQTSISWVDFVQLGQGQYIGVDHAIIADTTLVSDDVVGIVEFKVLGVVTNPNYRIQVGDAAILNKGTKLYRIEGFASDELIAAEDEHRMGGYRLYRAENASNNYNRNLQELLQKNIEKIEWYNSQELTPFMVLDASQSQSLVTILKESKPGNGDSVRIPRDNYNAKHYQLVMYTDEPIAYSFSLTDEGEYVTFYGGADPHIIEVPLTQWLP
jgi:hypothetical protein